VRRLAVRVPGVNASITVPTEEHREHIRRLLATALNFSTERSMALAPAFPLHDMRIAVRGDDVVACAGEYPFDQWFGGRPVACTGIWGVGTLPEHRTEGLATACTDALLRGARERGTPISSLFPAVLRPYRRIGYEVAGTFMRHRVPLDGLVSSREGGPAVELVEPDRDLAGTRDAYREWVRGANGPVEPTTEDHWRHRVLERPWDDTFRAVVVREGGAISGVASFVRSPDPGPLDIGFGLDCSLLLANTEPAWKALSTYFRGFRGLGKWLQWVGPASDPFAMLVPDAMIQTTFRYDWMLRLLDVPGAFEARGFPAIDATAVIAVDDPRWPANEGPWRIEVHGGEAKVTPAVDATPRLISIRALSAMFTGALRAPDAVRLGVLDADDPSTESLASMLSGPDPWCPFFF
jgi:predicted acetyltransferase